MKKIAFLLCLSCFAIPGHSQNNQIKLYLQQIAANKVYIEYLQKGYKIARKGLTLIGNIKNGEFSLHKDFFGSLKAINPRIKNMAKVADIITAQVKIINSYKKSYHRIINSKQFTAAEVDYIHTVFIKLLDDTAETLDELLAIITADHYQMSDDERIKRIEGLYTAMQQNTGFVQKFSNETLVLAAQRMKEKQDVETSRALYGISEQP